MVDFLSLLLLPVIIILGIVTSYQDIKFGKIKNKWISLALIYSFMAMLLTIFPP